MKIIERIFTFMVAAVLILSCLLQVQSSNISNKTNGIPLGWSNDINLSSNNTTGDVTPSIALNNSNINIVWTKEMLGHSEVFYINSTDAGQNWNKPMQISNGISGIHCTNPDIGISGENLHVVWEDNDAIGFGEIRYRSSPDSGLTWNPPKRISTDDGWYSQYAKIAVNGSEIHVVWVDERHRDESLPFNTELYYMRSLDGGITWDDGLGNIGQERRLTTALYESCGPSIVVEGDVIHLVWGDTRNGVTKGDIYYMRSLDKGATWDDGLGNVGLGRRLTTNNTNHMYGPIAVSGSIIHVTWVDEVWPGPKYYIYYQKSTDNGATWEPIQKLVNSGTSGSPDIAANGNNVNIVFGDSRDGIYSEVYYINSTDEGLTWNTEIRLTEVDGISSAGPKLVLSGEKQHITWVDQRDGNREIYYKRSPDFPIETTANLTLSPGWNLISFPVENPKLNGIPILRASDIYNATNCTMISRWNAIGQCYGSYITGFNLPTDPENFALNPDDAVFVWLNGTGNFTITGYDPGPRNVHLLPGWNTVGYVSNTMGDVETGWASQVSCDIYDDICWYNGTTFNHYIFPGTEMELVPTRGYFIWSDNDTWLSY